MERWKGRESVEMTVLQSGLASVNERGQSEIKRKAGMGEGEGKVGALAAVIINNGSSLPTGTQCRARAADFCRIDRMEEEKLTGLLVGVRVG